MGELNGPAQPPSQKRRTTSATSHLVSVTAPGVSVRSARCCWRVAVQAANSIDRLLADRLSGWRAIGPLPADGRQPGGLADLRVGWPRPDVLGMPVMSEPAQERRAWPRMQPVRGFLRSARAVRST